MDPTLLAIIIPSSVSIFMGILIIIFGTKNKNINVDKNAILAAKAKKRKGKAFSKYEHIKIFVENYDTLEEMQKDYECRKNKYEKYNNINATKDEGDMINKLLIGVANLIYNRHAPDEHKYEYIDDIGDVHYISQDLYERLKYLEELYHSAIDFKQYEKDYNYFYDLYVRKNKLRKYKLNKDIKYINKYSQHYFRVPLVK